MTSFSVCRKRNLHKHPPPELIKAALTAFMRCCWSIGTVTSDAAANVNTITTLLQQDDSFPLLQVLFQEAWWHWPGRCTRCSCPPSIHSCPGTQCRCGCRFQFGSFEFSAAYFPQTEGREGRRGRKGSWSEGWKTFTLPKFQYKWIVDWHCD